MTRVNPVHDDMNQTQIRPAASITERQKATERKFRCAAVLTVASNSRHADDFIDLLEMLGLRASEGRTP